MQGWVYFLIFVPKIYCVYSLEPPQRHVLNENPAETVLTCTHNLYFEQNKANNSTENVQLLQLKKNLYS